jgi:carbamoyl-phosphate synthase large subunit
MKSVGEVMAVGRTFKEALGKALRSLERTGFELGADGADGNPPGVAGPGAFREPSEQRILLVERMLAEGAPVDEVAAATHIDPWFVDQISQIAECSSALRGKDLGDLTAGELLDAKRLGTSDARLARVTGATERDVRARRRELRVEAVFKTVDTCAGEFEARTPYYYSTYEEESEIRPAERPRVVILGAGPNRIGQGIEFDYACVHAAFALREAGYETVMINCNPETVSTDYDTSDRLYFEPLTAEDVLAVCRAENPVGVIVQLGGQSPLKLAHVLEAEGFAILGTSPASIDLAEDRGKFAALLRQLGISAPPHGEARDLAEARGVARSIGYPVVVRPSYVLGGRAMEIVYGEEELDYFVRTAADASPDHPVLIDRFLEGAIEIDVDAIADGDDVFVGAVMEHIEEAGVHSGDSSCVIPPPTISDPELDVIEDITRRIARALDVRGLLNIQLALKDERVWVLEANPRSSRTVPFVSKATGVPLAKAAALVMAGRTVRDLAEIGMIPVGGSAFRHLPHVAVKAPVLPFGRFPGVDTVLGPEMKSTGEVMGIAEAFGPALAKALAGTRSELPVAGRVFVSVANRDKRSIVFPARRLADLGFELAATRGTAGVLARAGIPVTPVLKMSEGRPNVVDLIYAGKVDLVINTPFGREPRTDGYEIRTAAAIAGVPCITTLPGALAAVQGIEAVRRGSSGPRSLQEYHAQVVEQGPRQLSLEDPAQALPSRHGPGSGT